MITILLLIQGIFHDGRRENSIGEWQHIQNINYTNNTLIDRGVCVHGMHVKYNFCIHYSSGEYLIRSDIQGSWDTWRVCSQIDLLETYFFRSHDSQPSFNYLGPNLHSNSESSSAINSQFKRNCVRLQRSSTAWLSLFQGKSSI